MVTELAEETVDIDIDIDYRQSWLEKQWILILLRRGDITSAIAAIKNCDIRKQKYRTLQKQGNIEVCKNGKLQKTQEYQYRNSLCSGATFLRGLRRNTLTVLSK